MIRKSIILLILLIMTGDVLYNQLHTLHLKALEKNSEEVTKDIEGEQGPEVGKEAPDFSLLTTTGTKVNLSDFRGKKVIVNFWASWCPPCKKEMPEMQTYYEKKDTNTILLAVNYTVSERTNGEEKVRSFVKENGLTFPILLDTTSNVSNTYKIISLPTTYFIDSKGIIRQKYIGPMTTTYIENTLQNMQ